MNLPHGNKNPSATKSGPGRYHEQGYKKMPAATSPMSLGLRPPVGAITGTWHTGGTQRAAIKAAGSFRQYKRARMAPLRAARDAARASIPA